MRPVVHVGIRKGVVTVEVERPGIGTVVESAAEKKQGTQAQQTPMCLIALLGAVRPQTPLRLFDKKVRPAVHVGIRKGVGTVEAERPGSGTVAESAAEKKQAFACVLIIVIGDKG